MVLAPKKWILCARTQVQAVGEALILLDLHVKKPSTHYADFNRCNPWILWSYKLAETVDEHLHRQHHEQHSHQALKCYQSSFFEEAIKRR